MPKIENIIKFLFIVFIYTFPLDKLIGINSMSIISLAVISLIDFIPSIKKINKSKLVLLIFPVLIFIGYGISGLLSQNTDEGLGSLQVKLSLIVMPLIFISGRIGSSIDRDFIFKHFIIIMTLVMVYCISFNVIVRYWDIDNPYVKFREWQNFNSTFANPSGTQSIYLGYFSSFAILLIVFQWFKSEGKKLFYVITGALLFLGIILNGAKMATIGLLFLGTIEFIMLANKRNRIIGLAVIAILLCIVAGITSQSSYLKARSKELAPSNWKIPHRGEQQNSVNLRFAIYSCSAALLQDHWLKGIPSGDLQQQLNSCYLSNNYHEELEQFSFDTHSQYLNTWLSLGIAGLIVLLAMIISTVIYAIRTKDIILTSFMILIFLSFITENMLCTQKGVVFFSFFYCLLIVIGITKRTEPTNL